MNRISNTPSTFDMKKLKWVNAQHIKMMEDAELAKLTAPFMVKAGLAKSADSPLATAAAAMAKTKIEVLTETVDLAKQCFAYEFDNTIADNKNAATVVEVSPLSLWPLSLSLDVIHHLHLTLLCIPRTTSSAPILSHGRLFPLP